MNTASKEGTNVIAVAMDFAETGDNALREGVRLSRVLPNSELHVVHVLKTEADMHDAKKIDELSEKIQQTWESMHEHVVRVCAPVGEEAEGFTMDSVFHVRLGDPATAIHQLAVDVDADVIVVGTHARRGLKKLVLGSVAQELLETAQLPVVIARPKATAGLEKSSAADPARPGEVLSGGGLTDKLTLEFVPRTTHISGLF